MKQNDLIQSISVTRHHDKGDVSFTAYCPYGCTHTDFSAVHYGNEKEARLATIGKMINHCVKDHGVTLDDEKEV